MGILDDPLMMQFMENPGSVLNIQTHKISEELSVQPANYARIAYLYSVAKQHTNNCKMATEIKYSQVFREFRQEGMAEKTCEAYAKGHPAYTKIKQMYIDAEHQEMTVRAFMDGLQQKKDMLQQLGAIMRQEMVTNVSILEDQRR